MNLDTVLQLKGEFEKARYQYPQDEQHFGPPNLHVFIRWEEHLIVVIYSDIQPSLDGEAVAVRNALNGDHCGTAPFERVKNPHVLVARFSTHAIPTNVPLAFELIA
jgi:hypothetical protein